MICFPKAKVNFGINIVRRRPDGYHDIETLFYPIPLTDRLEINEASATTFVCDGLPVNGDGESNLVMRAFRLMQGEFSLPGAAIKLHKTIPMGAGLGGGSSDAAHTLLMLNEMYTIGLTKTQLCERAVRLGADCPFFIHSRPMLASGIGEILTPVDLNVSDYSLVLIKPDIHVSTADAYAGCRPAAWTAPLSEIVRQPVDSWRTALVNDFERTVFAKHPTLGTVKDVLYRHGATYAAMSGSGSTIYGLFASQPDRAQLDAAIAANLDETAFASYYI